MRPSVLQGLARRCAPRKALGWIVSVLERPSRSGYALALPVSVYLPPFALVLALPCSLVRDRTRNAQGACSMATGMTGTGYACRSRWWRATRALCPLARGAVPCVSSCSAQVSRNPAPLRLNRHPTRERAKVKSLIRSLLRRRTPFFLPVSAQVRTFLRPFCPRLCF